MTDLKAELLKVFNTDTETPQDNFYHFEPWDVEKRDDNIYEQARKDEFDLTDKSLTRIIGLDPHPYQTGYLLSTKLHRIMLGASRIGKSLPCMIEMAIMITHELPIALRYEKGVDTGVARRMTPENIKRWGRRDKETGAIIDHNPRAKKTDNWDCGNIIGAGIYPREKFAPPGSQLWVGTTNKALIKLWWPFLTQRTNMIVPHRFLDQSKGQGGINKRELSVFYQNDITLGIITFESGYDRFESVEAWHTIVDEENPDQRALPAIISHCKYLSMPFTPYHGITYTKDFLFPHTPDSELAVFHATAYDSPYRDRAKIEADRKGFKKWDIIARIWGYYSETTGDPYFDRIRIQNWIKNLEANHKFVQFIPTGDPQTIDELLATQIRIQPVDDDNLINTWRLYEMPKNDIGYVCGCDIAQGADTPQESADMNAAIIMRPKRENEKKPKIVATIRSTQKTAAFAKTVSYALRLYNNALLAAETQRGFYNGIFLAELRNWPWWFKMIQLNDVTGKPHVTIGFDTNVKYRHTIFELIAKWVDECEGDEHGIPDEMVLRELAAAVVGKNGRCDHTWKNTLDSVIAFGIDLYVLSLTPWQIQCNSADERKVPFPKIWHLLSPETREEAQHELGAYI